MLMSLNNPSATEYQQESAQRWYMGEDGKHHHFTVVFKPVGTPEIYIDGELVSINSQRVEAG